MGGPVGSWYRHSFLCPKATGRVICLSTTVPPSQLIRHWGILSSKLVTTTDPTVGSRSVPTRFPAFNGESRRSGFRLEDVFTTRVCSPCLTRASRGRNFRRVIAPFRYLLPLLSQFVTDTLPSNARDFTLERTNFEWRCAFYDWRSTGNTPDPFRRRHGFNLE